MRVIAISVALAVLPVVVGIAAGAPWLEVALAGYVTLLLALGTSWSSAHRGLPPLPDGPVRTRLTELAAGLSIPVPELVLMGTGGQQVALAWATGIRRPRVVVTDGLLGRLSAGERDAVLAHELAHLANGSLWTTAASGAVGWAAGLGAAGWMGEPTAALAALPLTVVVRQVVRRWFEIRCDRAAARLAGPAVTAASLDRIHAIRGPGGLSTMLVDATGSHPGLSVRRAAIRRLATGSERDAIPREATLCPRVAATTVLALALGGIGLGLALMPRGGGILVAVALAPSLVESGWRGAWLVRGGAPAGRSWGPFAAQLGFVALSAAVLSSGGLWSMIAWLSVSLVGRAAINVWWRVRQASAPERIKVLVLALRFRDALSLAERHPRAERDLDLATLLASAQHLEGDRAGAFARLERAGRRHRGAVVLPLLRGHFNLDDQPEQALAEAVAVTRSHPRDPRGWCLAARAARRLGQSAEGFAAEALRLGPDRPKCLAVAALSALDRGQLEVALGHLADGERRAPADTWIAVARAEVLRGGPDAASALEEAAAAVERNPLSLLAADLSRLAR